MAGYPEKPYPPQSYPPQEYPGAANQGGWGGGYAQTPQGQHHGVGQNHPRPPPRAHNAHVNAAGPVTGVPVGYQYPPRRNKRACNPKNGAEEFGEKWLAGPLLCSPFKNPLSWCCACVFPCCFGGWQRYQLLGKDLDQYVCCGGLCKPGQLCCERKCPALCCCLEFTCCLWLGAHGNRWMVQQRYGLQNTCCDVCLFWTVCLCSWAACICSIFGDMLGVPFVDELGWAADAIFCCVMGSMLAQQDLEMKKRGFPNDGGPPIKMPDF